MADFAYAPLRARLRRHGPRVLISKMEDGRELRRVKSSATWRSFIFDYNEKVATAKTMLDFAATKMETTFTIITWDPKATTPSTDEATVRLTAMPASEQPNQAKVKMVWRMVEVLT